MRVLVVCALLALAAIHASNADLTIAYVDSSIHEVDSFDQIPPDALCWGLFNDTILAQGWSTLELHTQPSSPGQDYSDSDLAYCAGYLEGYLTAPRIAQTFRNLENFTASTSNAPLMNFVAQQSEFVLNNIENPPAGEESYWHHVHLLNVQTKGLRAGYIDNKLPTDESYSETDFFLVQIDDEIGDILTAVGAASVSKEPKFDMGRSGCSAFVRAVPDDLFISQITWTEFQTMLRVYKLYDFPWALSEDSKDLVPATRISFSGYFGSLSSGDDYYQMNPSLLVSQETTNGVENGTLFQLYTTPSTNYEWVRTLLANRLASSAADWAKTFALYNSGTYNNQWMVLDYALYKQHKARGGSSKALPANLLVVAEQIPGTVAINDVTSFLNTRGYWASYNIPYDSNIFALSGYPQLLAQYGDFFSYEKCPRAQIFARDGPKVQTLADMQRIMRYNKFQTDPLSACDCTPPYSGENGIAARSDLNPANGTYPISALGHRCHGATDAKMTQLSLAEAGTTLAIVGPTYDDQPPFQWSLSDYHNLPHEGQPDLFKFDWMYIQWSDSAREIAAVNPHPVAAVA